MCFMPFCVTLVGGKFFPKWKALKGFIFRANSIFSWSSSTEWMMMSVLNYLQKIFLLPIFVLRLVGPEIKVMNKFHVERDLKYIWKKYLSFTETSWHFAQLMLFVLIYPVNTSFVFEFYCKLILKTRFKWHYLFSLHCISFSFQLVRVF